MAKTARGSVLAVFERSAYLDLGGRVLALASESLGRGPLTVSVRGFEALVPIEAGQPVDLESGVLRIGDRSVDLSRAAVWDPALPREEHSTISRSAAARRAPVSRAPAHAAARSAARRAPVRRAPARAAARADTRAAAIEELRRGAPEGSIAPLLGGSPAPRCDRATALLLDALRCGLDTVASMLEGVRDPADAAREAALWIAGRGPGLTPSGDDLLVGIMHAITVWPHVATHARREDSVIEGAGSADLGVTPAGPAARATPPGVVVRETPAGAEIRAMLAAAARGHTTRISAAHLDAAAQGWASEAWHDLVRSIHSSPAAVRGAVQRILRAGETSGADSLTGFCWAWARLAV